MIDPAELVVTQYTIYEEPDDAPDAFVVREWRIYRGSPEPEAGEAWEVDTLDAARELVRKLSSSELVCIPRSPDDDASIVETWT